MQNDHWAYRFVFRLGSADTKRILFSIYIILATIAAPIGSYAQPQTNPSAAAQESALNIPPQELPPVPQPTTETNRPSVSPDDVIRETPTRDIEKYEALREADRAQANHPDWAMGVHSSIWSFRKTNFARGANSARTNETPNFIGIFVSGEYIPVTRLGVLSFGAEAAAYAAPAGSTTHITETLPAFFGGGPYVSYQLNYFRNQLIVPVVRYESEWVQSRYTFTNVSVKLLNRLDRFDVGLMLLLTHIDATDAGALKEVYGIKRSYLGVYYSVARDSTNDLLDLSEQNFRFGFKLEF